MPIPTIWQMYWVDFLVDFLVQIHYRLMVHFDMSIRKMTLNSNGTYN